MNPMFLNLYTAVSGGVSIFENNELLAEDKTGITLNSGKYISNT